MSLLNLRSSLPVPASLFRISPVSSPSGPLTLLPSSKRLLQFPQVSSNLRTFVLLPTTVIRIVSRDPSNTLLLMVFVPSSICVAFDPVLSWWGPFEMLHTASGFFNLCFIFLLSPHPLCCVLYSFIDCVWCWIVFALEEEVIPVFPKAPK